MRPEPQHCGTEVADLPSFHRNIAATPQDVRFALAEILGALSPLSLSSEENGSIELVLAEAMNNIVEHAYSGDGDGEIDILVRAGGDGLHCRLRDTGAPMPEGTPPLGKRAAEDLAAPDLPEGGFGWFLIRELARELAYERLAEENILSFRIAVGIPATAPVLAQG